MLFTHKSEISGKVFAKDPAVIEIGKDPLYHSIMNDTLGIGIAESDNGKISSSAGIADNSGGEKRNSAPAAIKIDGISICFIRPTATAGSTPSVARCQKTDITLLRTSKSVSPHAVPGRKCQNGPAAEPLTPMCAFSGISSCFISQQEIRI